MSTQLVEAVVFTPSPVVTVTVEAGREQAEVHLHAGGQGVWVARMMRALGASVTVCAAVGGEAGSLLHPLIEREHIHLRGVSAETPNGTYVHDRRSGTRTVVAEAVAPPLSRHDLDALYGTTLVAAIDAGTCVLTGTVPPVVPADVYRRLSADLTSNDLHVVADLSGEALAAALLGHVGLVKVSDEELVRDGYAATGAVGDVQAAIHRLRAAGAGDVVVSRGKEPTLALLGDRLLEASSPRVEAIDERGAGDSMTAALAVAGARGFGPEEALRLAVAAGTLNVTRHGLATGQQEDIERLAAEVQLHEPVRTA